jgi:diguanylate cyclase (GGDEF)-like protein
MDVASLEEQRHRRRYWWIAAALVVTLLGVVGSVFSADAVAGQQAERAKQAFAETSAEIASTLRLAIQHEDDLILSGAAFVFAGDPDLTNTLFVKWAASMDVLARYPELQDFGDAVVVPASELAAFERRAVADPWAPLGPNGTFQVVPAGDRPFYCFGRVGMVRNAAVGAPAGFDFCASELGSALLAARDSGLGSYTPFTVGANLELGVQLPVYRGGDVPTTLAGRRAGFLGWFGTSILPKVLLDEALAGHPATAVEFRYDRGSSQAVFQSGREQPDARSVTTDLHNGWTVQTFGPAATPGILAHGDSLALLFAGIAVSLLVGALMFVLGTGRGRALRLVEERTGQLRHQALHDALTGLPNRALIMDRIEQLLARSRRNQTMGAALYVDLDEFKNVNDTLGHEAGDRLLVAVAARLQSALRDADTIGRMGGDEFIVLVDGASLEMTPALVAERLLAVMRQPFELDGATMPLMVNASIGVAVGDRSIPGDLLRDADVALYQAKAAGKNRYEIFHPEMQQELSRRIELEFDLRSAVAGDQFRLVYQPIYNLEDLTIVGVEALLRWDHPTKGVVQPDDFIPILEQTGQIREVGRWVLLNACTQMAAWHARGDTLDVSVNVSGRQLDSDTVVDHIREALKVSGLEPTSLIIEVTETSLMSHVADTARRLQAIKELGVRIAVDDFGTGYSSLNYLRQFPVDCLKIDRTFTNAITTSPESKALIGTLVQLGKDLGLKTLAEGVETVGEMNHLRGERVDEVQGFLFARPLDPMTLENRLLAPTRPTPTPNPV